MEHNFQARGYFRLNYQPLFGKMSLPLFTFQFYERNFNFFKQFLRHEMVGEGGWWGEGKGIPCFSVISK